METPLLFTFPKLDLEGVGLENDGCKRECSDIVSRVDSKVGSTE
jgi:hypothetical protein